VRPLCADFTLPLRLPALCHTEARRVVYFPGSTIGNLNRAQAIDLLRQTAALVGPGGGLLLGADLQKDPRVLEAAYNDARGVTAAFNRNLLARINRELGGDFAVDQFAHHAFYNAAAGRIEMHLVSRRNQRVHIGNAEFFFAAGESIRTEYSHKYTLPILDELADEAGFVMKKTWTDERDYFSVCLLDVPPIS
jgi:L-histidine N-alpha-methyltransferase